MTPIQRTAIALALVLALALNAVQAGQLAALEDYYRDVETVQGVFKQFTLDDRGQVIEESSGDFAIHRPDRFHWSYAGPFSQEIIADGERLWVYDVELDQVTVRDQRAVLGSAPAQLLSGDYADLAELFELAETEDYVRLTPRDGGEAFDEARLGMRDGHPSALEIDDALGQVTRVELDEVRINESVDADRFRFDPPEGVDVYETDPDEGVR
ncbi:MAG: outer membrane lipoprotein chaperone LolA [Halorhodospira halophila]|uniref:outer membrane lipoprotein chaperone LolA n=1 Tax=Halorhodospira TaxID=85108 RepID=UPI0019146806|nr:MULTISPECIES: outer membrane lipoprotein chaperone LolA [Halorhodospira]MCC3749963.1 outer membrane lipoprotein chaperone LolA [Halorhodospira halophila]MCG5528343.1 outer membrane lipoprotein chaperone LolA [Halorhodospira halophila]MCG5532137.1 outer membrane lipoprotein chaperone LolA [Halorhodospira sp. 9621]MCG5537103.1 outer membrane lipoprotein chaperone LolA [Halorhodospira sp. 9622]MCG5542549.1 outer membrane lipoprotein chaperone LolA [Halorhodospira sp. 9628]